MQHQHPSCSTPADYILVRQTPTKQKGRQRSRRPLNWPIRASASLMCRGSDHYNSKAALPVGIATMAKEIASNHNLRELCCEIHVALSPQRQPGPSAFPQAPSENLHLCPSHGRVMCFESLPNVLKRLLQRYQSRFVMTFGGLLRGHWLPPCCQQAGARLINSQPPGAWG